MMALPPPVRAGVRMGACLAPGSALAGVHNLSVGGSPWPCLPLGTLAVGVSLPVLLLQ